MAGAALLAPSAVTRWNRLRRNGNAGLLPVLGVAVAGALVIWAALDATVLAASGQVPLLASVFGWFGRGMGVAALLSGFIILATTATLARSESRTAYAWFVVSAAVSAVVTLLQAAGLDVAGARVDGEAPGLLGNADFASALYAIALVFTISAVIAGDRRWLSGGLAVLLLVAMAFSGPLQGPMATVAGLLVMSLALMRMQGGWMPRILLLVSGVLVAAGVVAVVLLRSSETIQTRILLWQTALTAMGQRPAWGSGPDGFARVFGAARPEAFLDLRPPEYHASAVHDVPLHLGATVGIPGLVLWLALVTIAVVALVRATMQLDKRDSSPDSTAGQGEDVMIAAVAGAVTAYVAQSLVSIDMLALLAVGWALLGSALASGRASPLSRAAVPTRQWASLQGDSPLALLTGCVLAVIAGFVALPNFLASAHAMDPVDLVAALSSPTTPCARREPLAQELVRTQGPAHAQPLIAQALALDPGCPGVAEVLVEAALNAGDMATAKQTAEDIIATDPFNTPAWIALAISQAASDPVAAQAALDRAEQLAQHNPKRYRFEIDQVRKLLSGGSQG